MNLLYCRTLCDCTKQLYHMQFEFVYIVMHVCICDNEAFSGLNEAIQSPQHVYSLPVISSPGSFSLPMLPPHSPIQRSPPLLFSSLLSSPLSVSFDKQICRQCPRITTSFDSQLTVNSQSQGGLHYINGKLDYFFSLETEGECKDSGGGRMVVGLKGIRPSNHVELPTAQGDIWQSGERCSHLICFV